MAKKSSKKIINLFTCIKREKNNGQLIGVIVQFGGQTPLKLSEFLNNMKVPILGTSVDSIDLAEDRERFKKIVDELNLLQPVNGIAYSEKQAFEIINDNNFNDIKVVDARIINQIILND